MQTQSLSGHLINSAARPFIPAFSAMVFGLMLVLLVGFAPVPAVHNAAHDTRHTAAFPCH
jgi:cobalt transporter subunit CbtB